MTSLDSIRNSDGNAARPLIGVQYLRGIAALMVALLHTTIQIPEMQSSFSHLLIGRLNLASGVDVFFVISGFIMVVSNRKSNPAQFALRRVIRIVPLYWMLTLLLAVLAVWQPHLVRTTVVTTEFVLKSLLFIPYVNPGHPGDVVPLLQPGWSLNFEMFFYLVFAIVLLVPQRTRVPIVGILFGALLLCGWLFPTLPPEVKFYTNGRLLEFWLGMLIADLYLRDGLRINKGCSAMLAVVGFLTVLTATLGDQIFSDTLQTLVRNVLPAAAIVLGMVELERNGSLREIPVLHSLGDASYSIYLTHIFTLGAARYLWGRWGLDQVGVAYALAFAVFSMLLVAIAGWLSYRLVEHPVLLFFQHKIRRPTPIPSGLRLEPPARS